MKKILRPENIFWTKPHSYSPTTLATLQKQVLQNEKIQRQQRLIELLAVETRLQTLVLLSQKSNVCVGDIADVLRLDISAVSHQLGILRKEGLVATKKKGKVVYYSLSGDLPKLVRIILNPATNDQS